MPKNKFYAVKTGKKPGIYNTWDECSAQVTGVKGAKYKSFANYEDAVSFLNGEIGYDSGKSRKPADADNRVKKSKSDNAKSAFTPKEDVYCFVDGSFNAATGVYGCGGFLMAYGKKYIIKDCDNDKDAAKHRNISGEVLGAVRAVEKAMELDLKEITIYHDYNGICGWANGWKTNIPLTQNYKQFINKARKYIKINFVQVPGHVGIIGNEEADRLAKEAVGLIV